MMSDPTDRLVVSISDIAPTLNTTQEYSNVDVFSDHTAFMPNLYKTMELPSYVHGYSLAIEYMREWFLKRFPPEPNSPTKSYFRTIYVNGKHVLDDWKNWNNYNIKREKPMLAIVPSLNPDWDRDNLDMYNGDATILLKRSRYQDSFLKDYENKIFLYLQMREMEMNFSFKIRVNSRSEQLDLMNKLELWFRVGTTQQDRVSADLHIPTDIMIQIAKDAHFEVADIKTKNGLKTGEKIVDIPAFLDYLNSHSSAPIVYKMRAINQKAEFFIRARDLYTHIAIKDKIQIDDGDRDGQLDTNFHLEMQVQLHMPIPFFYAYMNQVEIPDTISISERKPTLGIYTINNFDIPPENEVGWPSISVTSYYAEPGETFIDISSLFESDQWPVSKVLKYDEHMGLSPEGFIEVRLFHSHDNEYISGRLAKFHMDYKHMRIELDEELKKGMYYEIAIYADMKYVNNKLITMEVYEKSRVESDSVNDKSIKNVNQQNIKR